MPLYPLLFVLINFVVMFIEVISLAMMLRAILSWFFDSDGKFIKFLYVLTEPAIMPIRRLFQKLNWFQETPIDMAYTATYLVLMLVQVLLGTMVE